MQGSDFFETDFQGTGANMASLHVITHPLIEAKLTRMRDVDAPSAEFRSLLKEISLLMGYEITRDFQMKTIEVQTPIQ